MRCELGQQRVLCAAAGPDCWCLQAVKAMRFEEAGDRKSRLDTADTARERNKAMEEDLLAEDEADF